jgi:DNA-binding MarR family transcriptional regulator
LHGEAMNYEIDDKVKYVHKFLCETGRIYESMLRSMKITDSEYVLLFSVLEMGEGCLQKDIADNTHTSPKTLNSTVKKLEQKGLIRLEPGKYPNMHIYLTEKGSQYIKEQILPVIENENKIFGNVSNEDFNKFVSIVTKYTDIFTKEMDIKN